MAGMDENFKAHIATGATTLCRCWSITRKDGVQLGFTDHDTPLEFGGMKFKANSGLSTLALQQSTGLSVDNTEAIGALNDESVRSEDIEAGRFDGAEVRAWMVNWSNVSVRWLQFRGSIGELRRAGGAFHAELRGLTEHLNRPLGRIYQKPCTAVLGDGACRFSLNKAGYHAERSVVAVAEGRAFTLGGMSGFNHGWFTRGRLTVLTGKAKGLWGMIKTDFRSGDARRIELWEPIRANVQNGDRIRLDAGCDKRMESCRSKFNNLLNFQGFPDLPGEDWVMAVPKKSGTNTGGSLR